MELFHELAGPDSAAARRLVLERGLRGLVDFRNVFYEEVARDLASRGGTAVPALWDGERLHVGLPAIEAALAALASPS